MLRFFAEQFEGLELWGIEYSDAIDKSAVMAKELGHRFNLRKRDLLAEPDDDLIGYFDVVASFGLVEHFDDPGNVLGKLKPFVADGGYLVTVIPKFDGLYNMLWRLYDRDNYAYHIPISNRRLVDCHEDLHLSDVSFHTLGIPTLPGIHGPESRFEKALSFVITQLNGRILRRIYRRQPDINRSLPMTPTVACVGLKSGTSPAAASADSA